MKVNEIASKFDLRENTWGDNDVILSKIGNLRRVGGTYWVATVYRRNLSSWNKILQLWVNSPSWFTLNIHPTWRRGCMLSDITSPYVLGQNEYRLSIRHRELSFITLTTNYHYFISQNV